MKIYAVICSRDKEFSPITKKLVSKLSSLPARVMVMTNQDSIFSGYKKAFDKVNPDDNDIFILCHDDIEIKDDPKKIINAISITTAEGYGFVGVAGTKLLGADAVWWQRDRWEKGFHSGKVYHTDEKSESYETYYGPQSNVVVLDGVFLAASAKTLRQVGLQKPSYLRGNWDFYDLHYTIMSHKEGLINITVPLEITHHSAGEIVGKDGWHENRMAFIQKHSLPIGV